MNSLPPAFTHPARIRKRAEFVACYNNGKCFQSAHFLLFRQNGSCERRFGIAVSRKAGNAVQRNRVKRLLREFFRLHWSNFPTASVVAVAKKDAGRAFLRLANVEAELLPLLGRMQKIQH